MRQASKLYKQLRTQTGSYYEVKIVRGDVTYGMDKLKSITIDAAMFEGNGPQIGGVYSAQCKVKILEKSINWPRGAAFEVFIRITDGVQTDDSWMSMGTYYTDERHSDKYGNLEIIAFDAMLLLERPWTDKVEIPPEWPVTAQSACNMLSAALGIQFDSRTVLDNTVPFIGLKTTATARDTLAAVAAGMGGNWHVTPDGKLRLIPLKPPREGEAAIAGIAIAGIAIVGSGADHVYDGKSYIDLGLKVKDIDIGNATGAVTTVELEASGVDSENAVARASHGDGYVLKGKCDFSNSNVADLCLSKVEGYVYKPFNATSARLDPRAELGDMVQIDGDTYQLVSINWRIGPHITADISAPFEEAVDHEYPMLSESAKTLQKSMNYTDYTKRFLESSIEQTANSIKSSVASGLEGLRGEIGEAADRINQQFNNYYNKTDIDNVLGVSATQFEQTNDSFTSIIADVRKDLNGQITRINSYIRYQELPNPFDPNYETNPDSTKVGTIIVGQDGNDNRASVRINKDGIYLDNGGTIVSLWNQNEQLSPKALTVPVGGKLTIGSILFQPRSSGNMSLMWVGQNNGN